MFNTFINVVWTYYVREKKDSCKMATIEKGKNLECPKFPGKDEDYQVWITKFEDYMKVKGFYKVMAGTEVPAPASQVNKSAEELKSEERNDTGY